MRTYIYTPETPRSVGNRRGQYIYFGALYVQMHVVHKCEALCDFVETRHNEKIGIIKDIAAAGVGVAMFAWVLVLGFELEEMLRPLFWPQ